jgi:fatty-acyl-CoA synthase
MIGLMQDQPLLISSLIEFASRHHGDGEIVSRRVEGDIHRYTYRDVSARSRQVANALDGLQLAFGDRVATLAWNGYRHLELYFGVSGTGRVLHTLNPRLSPDQIAWIANHAQDQVLCFDLSFLPIVQALQGKATTIRHYVALCDADRLPADSGIPGLIDYEGWIGAHRAAYAWPEFDERSASSLCYTSGTTGNPKGVLRSVQPPLDHPACLRRRIARRAGHERARVGTAGGPDVPCQRLGASVCGRDDRREDGFPGSGDGR